MTYTLDWQTLIALSLVAGAAIHIVHRAWQLFAARGKSSCGGCGTCATGESKPGDGFISLESLKQK
jgi:hypothetical protein